MDFSKVIQEQTNKLIADKLPSIVEEKVTKLVDDIIGDLFRSYSDIGKAIRDKISKEIDVSLMEFQLVDYNAMVAKAIGNEFKKELDLDPIKKMVKDIVGVSDLEQISIYDICEKIKEFAMQDSDEGSGEISFYVDVKERHGWIEIFADKDFDVAKESCSVKVLVSKERGTIFSMSCNNYKTRGRMKEVSASDVVNHDSVENFFFKLYNNQVRIFDDFNGFYTDWDSY